jgi:hypothetical protein
VRYEYGSKKSAPRDGLASIVVGRAAGVSGALELVDPDGNQVVVRESVSESVSTYPLTYLLTYSPTYVYLLTFTC